MSLADRKALKALLAGVAGMGALAVGAAAMAQAIVVRSTGPSAAQYPQGRKLPATATVTLKPGDHITVLDRAGTRVLSGPGSFALSSNGPAAAAPTALASLMNAGGAPRTRTGAVRGAPMAPVAATPSGPDNIWYIDVSKGGTYCVADPAVLVLWRPNRTEEGKGKLLSADGSMADVTWKAGNALKLWPAATLPVVDGQTYTFSNPVGMMVKITTRLMGTVPNDEMQVASLLADKGCHAQLDVLANAAAPAASGGQ
jgi:hypothetical protein